jgi:hypothetical protein
VVHDVDPLDSGERSCGDGGGEPARLAGEGEDGAVVVRVGARVQQPSARRERRADLVEGREIAALGDIGNGEERPRPLLRRNGARGS